MKCDLCDKKTKPIGPVIVSIPTTDGSIFNYFCNQKCLSEYFQEEKRKKRQAARSQTKYATTSKGKATRVRASANYRARKYGGPVLPPKKGIKKADRIIINSLFNELGLKLEEKKICPKKR